MAKDESKFWQEVKKNLTEISFTRLESWASAGVPDLLCYNKKGKFFTIELKVDPLNLAGQKTVLQTVNNWNGERCVSGDSAVTVAGIRTLHHCHLIKTTPKSSKIK